MDSSLKMRTRLRHLMETLIHTGLIGFGGGSAVVPILQQTVVEEEQLVTTDQFNDDVVIASVTPGALPVEIAAGVGHDTCGRVGMVAGSCSVALPGVIITLLATTLLSQFSGAVIQQINFLSIGASAYILYVISNYVRASLAAADTLRRKLLYPLITAAVFLVTCEKELFRVFGADDHDPIFSIGTASVMLVLFFFTFWLQGDYRPRKLVPTILTSLLYCLCAGKHAFFEGTPIPLLVKLLMLGLIALGLRRDLKDNLHLPGDGALLRMLKDCAVSLAVMLVCSIPALLLYDGTADYLIRGCISSLTSFGGGDAYLALAGGMFVTSGLVLHSDFYSQLVPVVNASPGSILCKVLSGVGYYLGYRATGSVGIGLLVALAGFSCAIAMSCVTYSVGAFFYSTLEKSYGFSILKRLIRPTISGLLLTVGLGLFYNCLEIGSGCHWPTLCAPLLSIALAFCNVLFSRRFGSRPFYMVVLSALLSCLCCNLFGLLL